MLRPPLTPPPALPLLLLPLKHASCVCERHSPRSPARKISLQQFLGKVLRACTSMCGCFFCTVRRRRRVWVVRREGAEGREGEESCAVSVDISFSSFKCVAVEFFFSTMLDEFEGASSLHRTRDMWARRGSRTDRCGHVGTMKHGARLIQEGSTEDHKNN